MKRDDIRYFLMAIGGIDYINCLDLAPTQEVLDAFKKNKGDWSLYERDFFAMLSVRKVEEKITQDLFHEACLLCSEEKPLHGHRRLVAEYFRDNWENIDIVHL